MPRSNKIIETGTGCHCSSCRAAAAGYPLGHMFTMSEYAAVMAEVTATPGAQESAAATEAEHLRAEARRAYDVADAAWQDAVLASREARLKARGKDYGDGRGGYFRRNSKVDLAGLEEAEDLAHEARDLAWQQVVRANDVLRRAQLADLMDRAQRSRVDNQ